GCTTHRAGILPLHPALRSLPLAEPIASPRVLPGRAIFDQAMRTLHALLLSALALAAHAQWELTTPIKTRSEFHHIHMVNDLVAYAADKPMGSIVRTVDGGHSWTRPYQNHFNDPMAVFMWDELR